MRLPIRLSLVLLSFCLIVPSWSFGQTEAESSASDAFVQSRVNGRTKDVNIGQTIRYRLDGEKRYSKRSVFKGIDGEVAIFGRDTIALDQLESIRPRNDRTFKTGKNLLIAGLIIRGVSVVAAIGLLITVGSGLGFAIVASLILAALSIVGVPLFYTGLIMMLASTRTFQVKSFWKFRARSRNKSPEL